LFRREGKIKGRPDQQTTGRGEEGTASGHAEGVEGMLKEEGKGKSIQNPPGEKRNDSLSLCRLGEHRRRGGRLMNPVSGTKGRKNIHISIPGERI